METCFKCNSTHVVKQGFVEGKQRYKCRNCKFQSIRSEIPDPIPRQKKLLRALCLFLSGLSKNMVAKHMGVSCQSVCNWIREMGDYEKLMPKPKGNLVTIEMDEMWHFLQSKKQKLWIGKAYCRETGELVAFSFGKRDFGALVDLVSRLRGYKMKIFYTDHFGTYQKLIPEDMLIQSKAETVAIKRNNGRQRHWLAPFRRKSIVVSKSLEILESTLVLFAYWHVNNSFQTLLDLTT